MKESKTTGEILREKREKKGLLLRQVAALLDIDTAILSKIERSERKASKEQIIKLAKILELDEEDLIVQFLSEKILYEIKDEELGS
ncbi:MAG: helix-turn-helix transcriptional regulator, partial [Flavobacteriales bacterium]|nr:helix-turn-helix transcriptional regulator [Flavobacteriales bacterium]